MSNLAEAYPLAPSQQGVLYEAQAAPGLGLYVEQVHFVAGPLDREAWRAAWETVVAAHAALRTAFLWEGHAEPLQVVRKQVPAVIAQDDWSAIDEAAQDQRVARMLREDRLRGFDLHRAPLFRLRLVRLGAERDFFLWTYHHAILDGWSEALVLGDVLAAYRALRMGGTPVLPVRRPFRDYLAWQRSRDKNAALAAWRDRLAARAPLPLPLVEGNDAPGMAAHGIERATVSPALSAALNRFARDHALTQSTLLLGAWMLLLARSADSAEACTGVIIAGRPPELAGSTGMIGMFVNSLPFATAIDGDATVADWLRAIQADLAALRPIDFVALADLQREIDGPLFESLFVFENYPVEQQSAAEAAGLEIHRLGREPTRTLMQLTLVATPGEQLAIEILHDTRRFAARPVRRMLEGLERLLGAFIERPDARPAALSLLGIAERDRLLGSLAGAGAPPPAPPESPIALFSRHAQARPDIVAVRAGGATLDYGALSDRARRLAMLLRAQGVGPDRIVAVQGDRSVASVVAILGILLAGGAYLPLDPALPPQRRAAILADAGATIFLSEEAVAELPPGCRGVLISSHDVAEAILPDPSPEDLAYVIYTSGSTGDPKGVMIERRELAASTAARRSYYEEPVECFLLASPFQFDSSVAGLFWTLAEGGALIIPQEHELRSAAAVAALIARHRVSHLLCLPSLYAALLDGAPAGALSSLRTVIVAGEACAPAHVAAHFALLPDTRLFNEYGPTEATVWCSVHRCEPADAARPRVPIGRPIATSSLLILDRHGQLMPEGVAGELCVGGEGLARGYLGRPGLTAERFVANPFGRGRLYRTGDRARHLVDGTIDLLGRTDAQVKIRGHRVEPGEIEAVLMRVPAVEDTAVVAVDGPGGARLIAFVVPRDDEPAACAEAERAARERLSEAMVPSLFRAIVALPRTRNGKVDRRALAAMHMPAAGDAPPSGEIAERLAAIWRGLLKLDAIGADDNFFALGGDSILALQLVARAERAGLAFEIADLFAAPTIAELAPRVREASAAEAPADAPASAPLTPIQRWFLARWTGPPGYYGQVAWIEFDRPIAAEALSDPANALVARHDALRLRFTLGGDGRPSIADAAVPPDLVTVHALGDLSIDEQDRAMAASAGRTARGFDLAAGGLFRMQLFRLGPARRDRLAIVAHHLVIDALSWRILLDELDAALRGGSLAGRPQPALSYRGWASRDPPASREDEQFWRTQPWNEVSPLGGEPGRVADERRTAILLPGSGAERLDAAAARHRTTVEELLLAAIARATARVTGRDTVLIDCEGHGRSGDAAADLSRTVGWFTTLFPALLRLEPATSAEQALAAVKAQWRAQRQRGGAFARLRWGDGVPPDWPDAAIAFNYLGRIDGAVGNGLKVLPGTGNLLRDPAAHRLWLLEINAWRSDDALRLTIAHREGCRLAAPIAAAIREGIGRLIDEDAVAAAAPSPADFPMAKLDRRSLARLLDRIGDTA